jgi:hypothetical protein
MQRILTDKRLQKQASNRFWTVETSFRPKRREYLVSITDGVYFIGFFGKSLSREAKLESELRGALSALDWLKHDRKTPAEITFSVEAFAVFLGEEDCPRDLKSLLDQVRRAYITSADSVRIDRERHAIVSIERRVAA